MGRDYWLGRATTAQINNGVSRNSASGSAPTPVTRISPRPRQRAFFAFVVSIRHQGCWTRYARLGSVLFVSAF